MRRDVPDISLFSGNLTTSSVIDFRISGLMLTL